MMRNQRIKKPCCKDLVSQSIFESLQRLFYRDLASPPTYARVKNERFRVLLLISCTYIFVHVVRAVFLNKLTAKQEKKFFLLYKEIQKGSGAKSYRTNGLLLNK